jgi:hypothetical protein
VLSVLVSWLSKARDEREGTGRQEGEEDDEEEED